MTTASKPISFELNAKVPAGVQVREIDGEAILLNLDSGLYFGLNATGSRFLADVTRFETIERAFEDLLETYDAEPEELRAALSELLAELVENGLIELSAR
ncbi:MAG: PqqD family protein [Acidobacteriota bacterium]|nr:PqqD family protein [Acidobacteriota bacterium]